MPTPTKKFTGKVIDGKLILNNPKLFSIYLQSLEGKKVELGLRKEVRIRSTASNNYYWLYLGVISEENGDDVMSLHGFFKQTLLPPQTVEVLGKETTIQGSTRKLSTYEMSSYIKRIEALTGIPAPDPNEYYA